MVEHVTRVITRSSHAGHPSHYAECDGCPWRGRPRSEKERAARDGEQHEEGKK